MFWLAVLGGVAGIYFGGCYFMALAYVSPVRLKPGERLPGFVEVGFLGNGYVIPAWRGGSGEDVFVLVHGFGGTQGYWNPLAAELVSQGEVVILATMGQTVSPIKQVGFGEGESGEVLVVVRALKAEGKRVHLVGVSMGGAASWIAAGLAPELISTVTTEAAFARLDWAGDDFLSVSIPGGARVFRPIVLIAQKRRGVVSSEVRPAESASRWQGPSLIFHSRDDGMFGARHPEAISGATGGGIRWYEGLKHSEIFQDRAPEVAEMIRGMVSNVE
ncbi:MAG: alpha/beta fold hydrolase [Fimbriimonadaceae bacterium]